MWKVLIVESSEGQCSIINDLIQTAIPDSEVCTRGSVRGALTALAGNSYDLIVLGFDYSDGDGLRLVREVRKRGLGSYCLVFNDSSDEKVFARALKGGVDGYLLSHDRREFLLHSIEAIGRGEAVLSLPIQQFLLKVFRGHAEDGGSRALTRRECDILAMIGEGKKGQEIAFKLGIKPNTVTTHIRQIYWKLNISTRSEAALEAVRRGLVNL